MRTLVALLLASTTVAAQQRDARVAAGGTAEITGVVVGSDGRQPIRRAIVNIAGDQSAASRSVITDDSGRFAFRGLPAGTFAVTAKKAAYLNTEFASPKPGRPGSRIALAASEKRAITLTLFKGAVIGGIVRLPNGAAASGVSIVVLNPKLGRRDRGTDPVVTNDLGEYRIYGLTPGEYIVAATLFAGGSGDIGARSSSDMDALLARLSQRQSSSAAPAPASATPIVVPPAPVVGYAPIFFPGTPVFGQAETIRLAAEEERDSVSFTVSRVPVATVKGTVSGDGVNLAAVQLALVPEARELRWAGPSTSVGITAVPPNAAGEFAYANLSPGTYQIVARGRNAANDALYATADVEIHGQDIRDLALPLRPGGTMSGTLVFESGGTMIPADPSRFRVGVSLVGDAGFLQMAGLRLGNALSDVPQVGVRGDSTFHLTGIGPSSYTISCTVPPELITTWRLRSAIVDGRDLLDTGITGPDVSLRGVILTLSDKRTELSGSLVSATGQPAAEYYVIAFSTDRANWRAGSRRSMAARPATDGRFVFTDLPAGEYFVTALTDLDPDAWQEPAFLEQAAAAAVQVTLAEGQKKVQDLRIK